MCLLASAGPRWWAVSLVSEHCPPRCADAVNAAVPAGVEMFKKQLSEGQAGDNVGLLVRGIKRDEVERGQVACKPGSIAPALKFEGELYALTKEEGGRHTPFFTNYKPQFFFRTADITGASILLPFPVSLFECRMNQLFAVLTCVPTQGLSPCLRASRWSCLATTLQQTLS